VNGKFVCLARDGRGKFAEFNPRYNIAATSLPDQRAAAELILASRDFVTLFCGGRGNGQKSHVTGNRQRLESCRSRFLTSSRRSAASPLI